MQVRLEKNFGPWPLMYWFPEPKIVFWRSKKVASGATGAALASWGIDYERVDAGKVQSLAEDPEVLVVGLFRHPFDRVVSCWHFPGECEVPLRVFCEQIADTEDRFCDRHVAAQSWMMPEKAVLFRLDKEESWPAIQKAFAERHKKPLPDLTVQNRSERGRWEEYLRDPLLKVMLRVRYAEDFARWGSL